MAKKKAKKKAKKAAKRAPPSRGFNSAFVADFTRQLLLKAGQSVKVTRHGMGPKWNWPGGIGDKVTRADILGVLQLLLEAADTRKPPVDNGDGSFRDKAAALVRAKNWPEIPLPLIPKKWAKNWIAWQRDYNMLEIAQITDRMLHASCDGGGGNPIGWEPHEP